ncbi:MAG: hypothetical protein ACI39U_05410 [Candidatus Cryptobacteroides sp.]
MNKNLIPIESRATEVQREIRSKGGKARARKLREQKTIAAALRQVLGEPVEKGSKVTKLDALVAKTVKNLYDAPSVKGLKILAELLGELEHKITSDGLTLNITASDEGKKNIERIIDGD